jgi:hypothetical protein
MEILFREETMDAFLRLKKALSDMPYLKPSEEELPYYLAVYNDMRAGHPPVKIQFNAGREQAIV